MAQSNTEKAIWVVTDGSSEAEEAVDGERWGKDIGGGFGDRSPSERGSRGRRSSVSFTTLKSNTTEFLSMVGELFEQADRQKSAGMKLNEVELAVEINAEGELSILGSGGKVGGKGAITLKFKRE